MPRGPGHMAGAAGEGGQGGPIKARPNARMSPKNGVTQHQAMLNNLDIDF